MEPITDISTYLRAHAQELGDRILESYPPLHSIDDPPSPMIGKLLRKPFLAQTLAIMGLTRVWQQARAGAVIAECGTGKTLISLGAVHTHSEGRPYTALVMAPGHVTEKWCREALLCTYDHKLAIWPVNGSKRRRPGYASRAILGCQ
jgi:hypothetical protein